MDMNANLSSGIEHTVFFKLKTASGSEAEAAFFDAAKQLALIPGVKNFKVLKQISAKNNFDYGLSMHFDSTEEYYNYNSHPQHVAFIQEYWMKNVEDFLEIDHTEIV